MSETGETKTSFLKLKARLIGQLRVTNLFAPAIFRLDKTSLHQGLERIRETKN